MGIVFSILIIVVLLSFIFVEITILRRWRAQWRLGALLPVLVLAAVIINIVIGVLRDRTSHNLWPMEIVVWSTGGLIYLGVLSLIHKVTTKAP